MHRNQNLALAEAAIAILTLMTSVTVLQLATTALFLTAGILSIAVIVDGMGTALRQIARGQPQAI